MPVAYACIVPPRVPADARIASVVPTVAEEVAQLRPEALVAIASPPRLAGSIGVWSSDEALLTPLLRAAGDETIPAQAARHDVELPPEIEPAVGDLPRLAVTTARLEPAYHLAFGRALALVLAADERRTAIVCTATLASTRDARRARQFDTHYRRAIEEWSVKWLTGLEAETRRLAGEDAVAQTAVLMGALSRSRIQPRVLAYDDSGEAGQIVAAIDVLGARRPR